MSESNKRRNSKCAYCNNTSMGCIKSQRIHGSRLRYIARCLISYITLSHKIHSIIRVRHTGNLSRRNLFAHNLYSGIILIARNLQLHRHTVFINIPIQLSLLIERRIYRGLGCLAIFGLDKQTIHHTICTVFSIVISQNIGIASMKRVQQIICLFCCKSVSLISIKAKKLLCMGSTFYSSGKFPSNRSRIHLTLVILRRMLQLFF